MDTPEILSNLFDKKTVELLKVLLIKEDIFYLRDLSRETKVSLATTYRIVQKLLKLDLVKKETKGKLVYYILNKNSEIHNQISTLVLGASAQDPLALLRQGLNEKYLGMYEIYVLKGKKKKIFIISDFIDSKFASEVIKNIKEQTSEVLDYMVVTKAQFDQMQQMGLVPKN